MANAINYATRYERELDQAIVQGALTGVIETPRVNWLDAKSFKIPNLGLTGYKNHSRNGGFNRGDVTVTDEVYTLAFDRDVEFFVDSMDVDESNQAASAGNVTFRFVEEHAIPEIDAYRFAKLATATVTNGTSTSETLTQATAIQRLNEDIAKVRKYGLTDVVCFVSAEVMDMVQAYKLAQGTLIIEDNVSRIDSRVTHLNGVELREVWDMDRFVTKQNFATGFTPAADAKEINWLIIVKPAVLCKTKHSAIYLFAPGTHTEGDGYLYQNRLYHDIFILKHKQDGVVSSVKP